jgi:ribosomal protein S18 acetylase RimI-like enzyme
MNDLCKISPLSSENLPELVRLTKAYFSELDLVPEFHNLDQDLTAPLKAYAGPRGGFWLAENDKGKAWGMAGLLPLAPRTCELKRLYVVSDARRMGLGQKLLHQALDFARQAAYLEILVSLHHNQTAALKLFDSHGFKPVSRFNANRQAGIFLAYKFSSDI